ncbi:MULTISPECIES: M61 family metallopeptidase [unclassified Brevundimonas]|uniref:M61 family metallopeptidase n=1 Tax=unclassified Brevundimonas TaxID=2622653 RepID=UPI000CFDDAB6|nr:MULTISPECIES: M61 family metallopeptidase [unclassified Brevundimonas]PQZ81666.1 peptidase M61 [Brevundimonas sp. MYb31]PRB11102.1 peptidase M61 [Brevundimonas sp. MYb52]PRB32656.1 peptidase M61 [Brevundimonas sp. MYb46]PRB44816.1 peptidase M61 [Brevundimonas sp. MYb33]
MTRRLPAAALVLLLTSVASTALAHAPQAWTGPQAPAAPTPQNTPLGLPRALPPIPAPTAETYPGVIKYEVDATDVERKIIRVRQTIPVTAGPLVLLYPKFLPGNHAATGPIQLISGVTVTSGQGRIDWLRDTIDPNAFHIDVPQGVSEIVVEFQWLTQPDSSTWRVVMTPEMVNLQWEKALLYPAGYRSTGITFAPSIRLPEGWKYGVALDTDRYENGVATFRPTDLYTLIDSPLFGGAHFQRIEIDPKGEAVHLNIVADEAKNIAPTPEQIAWFENLVTQTDRLFGARPYDRYDFLVAATSKMGGIGLEHHRSSENSVPTDFFTNWGKSMGAVGLLPHEFVHAWNGKRQRPADELTANHNIPTQNTLLWVYEGQTEYWGDVLTARSGLASKEDILVTVAENAAFYDNQPGREWRPLQDVNNHNLLGYRTSNPYSSWMRGTGDYYRESLLIWLDADTLIREATDGKKSLDDFAKGFFGGDDGSYAPRGYTFDDVVAALNAVHPHDWTSFLRTRLDATGPDAKAPLDGLARGGYRLTYTDALTAGEKRIQSGWATDFQYSLGFTLSSSNKLTGIRWGGRAFEADIGPGWELVAVNDRAASAEVLRDAVTAAKGTSAPISLLLKNGDRYRTVAFDYHDGLRYPRLERIPGTPDRISDILSPRRR